MLSFYVLIPSLSVKSSGTVVSLCLHLLSYFSFSFGLCLSQFASFCFCLFLSLVSSSNCPCLSPRRFLFHPLLFVSKCLFLSLSISIRILSDYALNPVVSRRRMRSDYPPQIAPCPPVAQSCPATACRPTSTAPAAASATCRPVSTA
jgi:hypothetical protein